MKKARVLCEDRRILEAIAGLGLEGAIPWASEIPLELGSGGILYLDQPGGFGGDGAGPGYTVRIGLDGAEVRDLPSGALDALGGDWTIDPSIHVGRLELGDQEVVLCWFCNFEPITMKRSRELERELEDRLGVKVLFLGAIRRDLTLDPSPGARMVQLTARVSLEARISGELKGGKGG